MPVVKAQNYLITLPKVNPESFLTKLFVSCHNFEILDPSTVDSEWINVSRNFQGNFDKQDELSVLSGLIEIKQNKGIFAGFIDDRYEANLEDLKAITGKREYWLGLALAVNRYQSLITTENEILEFIATHQDKQLLLGNNLENFASDFEKLSRELVMEARKHSGLDVEVEIPQVEVKKIQDFDALIFAMEDYETVKEFLDLKYHDRNIFSEKQALAEISKQQNKFKALLKDNKIDPDNLSEEFFRNLAILHASLELDKNIQDSLAKSFSLSEEAKTRFIFISIAPTEETKFLELLSEFRVAFEQIEANKEIVDWVNSGGLKSFQGVAQSIGTINTKEADPTGLVSIFFMIFFAFCLADAVYGLGLVLFTGYFLFFKKLKPGVKDFFNLFFYSGLTTVLLGILTNSWAGDFFNSNFVKALVGTEITSDQTLSSTPINDLLANFQLIDIFNPASNAPVNSAIEGTSPILVMMVVAVFIGFLNSLAAYYLKAVNGIKAGNWSQATSQFAWTFFIFAICLAIAENTTQGEFTIISLSVLTLGTLSIFIFNQANSFTGKILGGVFGENGLYGLVQLGANLMSYTRIVAIGLTGGMIANVVNLLAGLVYVDNQNFIGLIIAILILLIGHSFNIVLSLFSAYINPIRLTYVEFMPKFFEGKGRQIQSERNELKYLNLKVENT